MNHDRNNLESELIAAKKERFFTMAPVLRRVVNRARWFGTIGGVLLFVGLGREVLEWEYTSVQSVGILLVATVVTVSLVWASRKISSAATVHDFPMIAKGVANLRKILKVAMVLGATASMIMER